MLPVPVCGRIDSALRLLVQSHKPPPGGLLCDGGQVLGVATKTGDDHLDQFAASLRNTWLKWGVGPLAVGAVLLLVATAAAASPDRMSERALEIRFQVVLAIGAGLFLIGFSLDSHWTNAQKLARRIARAAGLPDLKAVEELKKRSTRKLNESLAAQSQVAADSILASTLALTIIGGAIVATAVLAAAAGLGFAYSAMLWLLAAEYQLFVLSRHPYYKELLQAAEAGDLVATDTKAESARKRWL